jgi:hypothetical protein
VHAPLPSPCWLLPLVLQYMLDTRHIIWKNADV